MKIYRQSKIYNLGNSLVVFLILFLGLTLPKLIDGVPATDREIKGLAGFWIIWFIITIAPFGSKLEIGDDYVKNYFLGFCVNTLKSSEVLVMEYGNLMKGGLGYGKGLKIRLNKGFSKTYSISEKSYGREAIKEAEKALSK